MLDLEGIKMKIAELEQSMEHDLPGYKIILSQIHKETRGQPELLYKLNDEQIAVLISGLGKIHNTEILIPKTKEKITKKQGQTMSADDV
jgi:TATA-box binding protein (TBP) (component of TFIID and TFIIIB)